MMRYLLVVAALALAAPVQAAGPVDPDWPCIQRRVAHLSPGQVWAGPPIDDAVQQIAQSADVQALARVLALRRTEMPRAEEMIAGFAEDADAAHLTALFAATFDHINLARDRIMTGITRYSHKQIALDERIKEQRHEFERLSAAAGDKDFDRIDALEREIDWSTRIFRDRQQSLTYVCETPVILEQRAFALGRAIMARLPQ